jgi:hypothetical protein
MSAGAVSGIALKIDGQIESGRAGDGGLRREALPYRR